MPERTHRAGPTQSEQLYAHLRATESSNMAQAAPSQTYSPAPLPGHPSHTASSRPLPQGYTHAASDGYTQPSRPAIDDRGDQASNAGPGAHHHGRSASAIVVVTSDGAQVEAAQPAGRNGYYEPSRHVRSRPSTSDHSPPSHDPDHEHDHEHDEIEAEEEDRRRDARAREARQDSTTMAALALREAQAQEVLRHGFHEVYNSEDYLAHLSRNYYLYWTEERFKRKDKESQSVPHWHQPSKHRTVAAALFLCLRIGFDPPDIVKTDPCAKLEAWTDPWSLPRETALSTIGKKLTEQFESLAPAHSRIKFKTCCDVYIDECKKVAVNLRKFARTDRALVHYNGHGVPKPTPSGEIWVFNKLYTQYIPVSLYDLLGWLGPPAVFIWDVSNAGNIVSKVVQFSQQRDDEDGERAASGGWDPSNPNSNAGTSSHGGGNDFGTRSSVLASAGHVPRFVDTIQLAACSATQTLPSDPNLPADLFTSCLTSPIEMALRFYVLQNDALKSKLASTSAFATDLDALHNIPGRMEMRRTPLGELTWIFTSVTDAIAWNCLPRGLFARIFRGDLVLAALFRGYLLAERVMRAYSCTPQSVPALPETHTSHLWKAWDLAVDMCLSQLPALVRYEQEKHLFDNGRWPRGAPPPKVVTYHHSTFFAEQLTAFEVWLDEAARMAPEDLASGAAGASGGSKGEGGSKVNGHHGKRSEDGAETETEDEKESEPDDKDRFPPAPPQLPIVLQVLLSQMHRLRALILLCRFMDMGPWAVYLSLSIGIFQYVLKLLQAPAPELKPVLIFIWARILTVYPDGRNDLFRPGMTRQNAAGESPIEYFVRIFHPDQDLPIPNVPDHKAMCAFILSVACRNSPDGQRRLLEYEVLGSCVVHLDSPSDMLRQWTALLLAHLWDRSDEVKGVAIRVGIHNKLSSMLRDKSPEVRAAVLYALGTLVGTSGAPDADERVPVSSLSGANPEATGLPSGQQMVVELGIAMACVNVAPDGSAMVRKELVILLSAIVAEHQGHFVVAAYEAAQKERERLASGRGTSIYRPGVVDRGSLSRLPRVDSNDKEREDLGMDPSILSVEFMTLYTVLLDLSLDPFPEVSRVACLVVDYIHSQLLDTPLGGDCIPLVDRAVADAEKTSPAVTTLRVPSVPDRRAATADARGPINGHVQSGPTSSPSLTNLAMLKGGKGLVSAVRSLTQMGSSSNLAATASASSSTTQPQSIQTNGSRSAQDTLVGSPESYGVRPEIQRLRKRDLAPLTPAEDAGAGPSNDEVVQVISRLRESDRLRRRRRRAYSAASSSAGQTPSSTAPPSPVESYFDNLMSPLPLRSEYYDWSSKYFLEPQMNDTGDDQPGSRHYHEALWRKHRNEQVIINTQPLKEDAATCRWDSQISSFANESTPTRVVLHQFEDHLIASDDEGFLTVYDWQRNVRLNRFANTAAHGTRITTLKLVNEDDVALLLTGSSDGTVRLFRNYHLKNEVEVVTAFRGLPSIEPSSRAEAGLIAEWQQGCGQLLIGGNTREIRVWDAYRETSHYQIMTRANSCITSLSSDQVAGFIVAAGFGDGSVRIYDRRVTPRDAMIRAYRGQHSAWVQTIHMQRGGQRELLSGDLMGEVCQWDIRFNNPLAKIQTHQEGMPVMAVHEHAPVFATGSTYNVVKIWPVGAEDFISKFRNSSAVHSQIHKPVVSLTAMAFHPHRMMLAAGSADSQLSVYQCDTKRTALAAL